MKKIILVFIAVISFMSCDKTLDRLLVNPNNPSPDQADANLYLNQAELSFAGFFNTASGFGMELTRMLSMFGPRYDNTYTPQSYDGIWNTAYTGVIKHCNALIPIADAQKRYVHVGMAKIMKAYTFLTLVDLFGNVPFTEANQGVDNLNPKADAGATVYAGAIALLDEAITDLGKTSSATPGSQDLFFGGSAAKWITTAKTLKLRALMNIRLVDASAKTKIETILNAGDLIDNNTNHSEDFEFKYSKKGSNPNSRHPRYNGNHTSTGAGDYIGTYFMWSLAQEKGTGDANNDPRTRYYLYRQETNYAAVTENTINCFGQAYPGHYATGLTNVYTGGTYDMPFCLLISGFWGRDHGDDAGIPPDGQLRTTVGVYPFGGRFDGTEGATVAVDFGGQGAGIQPLWQSSYTEFLRAEYELMLNNNAANARTRLESGVRYSIKKVIEFPAAISYPGTISTALVPDATKIDNYVNKALTAFDNAATTSAKLNIIMKEYYMALWGNGVDAYNLFRRTNKPEYIQYVLEADPGPFVNSHLYPSVFVNRNLNAAQKANVGVQVFWDNWPANSRR